MSQAEQGRRQERVARSTPQPLRDQYNGAGHDTTRRDGRRWRGHPARARPAMAGRRHPRQNHPGRWTLLRCLCGPSQATTWDRCPGGSKRRARPPRIRPHELRVPAGLRRHGQCRLHAVSTRQREVCVGLNEQRRVSRNAYVGNRGTRDVPDVASGAWATANVGHEEVN